MTTPDETSVTSQPKRRQTRRRIILFTAVAIILGWFAYTSFVPRPWSAEIRVPTEAEEVPLDRFHWPGATNPRSIATVSACFTRDTWVTTEVYAVEDGEITLIARQVTGRSSNRIGEPHLKTFPVTFALADAKLDDGHTTLLTMEGATRSAGNFGGLHQPFDPINSETFTGRIDPGETRLLYLEADRPFTATPTESIEDFAANNHRGRFLVVTIGFDR